MEPEANLPENMNLWPNYGYSGGQFLSKLLGGTDPMGTWTGMNPLVGAPVSGALWGAGLGGLYAGGKALLSDKEEDPDQPPRPWWKHPATIGAGLGTVIGLLSGYAQTRPGFERAPQIYKQQSSLEKQAASPSDVIRVIMNDPRLSDWEKDHLIKAVMEATPGQLQQLLGAALAGTLTASLAHSILGTGFFGSALAGGIGGFLAHNLLPGPTRYV